MSIERRLNRHASRAEQLRADAQRRLQIITELVEARNMPRSEDSRMRMKAAWEAAYRECRGRV